MGTFNATKDQLGYYVTQARDSAAEIIAVLLQDTGLETDGALADHDTLAALLTATNDEATFTNYTRLTTSTPSRTVDDTGDRVLLGVASPLTWANAGDSTGTGVNNTLGMLLLVYDPDPATSTDSTRLPLSGHNISATTDGNDLVVTLHADGFTRVTSPV